MMQFKEEWWQSHIEPLLETSQDGYSNESETVSDAQRMHQDKELDIEGTIQQRSQFYQAVCRRYMLIPGSYRCKSQWGRTQSALHYRGLQKGIAIAVNSVLADYAFRLRLDNWLEASSASAQLALPGCLNRLILDYAFALQDCSCQLRLFDNEQQWQAISCIHLVYGCYAETCTPFLTRDIQLAEEVLVHLEENRKKATVAEIINFAIPKVALLYPSYWTTHGDEHKLKEDEIRLLVQSLRLLAPLRKWLLTYL